ncbi:MAG TPA: NACHT domain-containing protein, partial [Anaerolineae bacterium]|nr:NACHT domain-containing protein [Anaerolineae bacterium]
MSSSIVLLQSFVTFWKALPDDIKDLLLGATGDGTGGIAGEIVMRCYDKLRRRQRQSLVQYQPAYGQVVAQALYVTACRLTDDQTLQKTYTKMLGDWAKHDDVNKELVQFVDIREDIELDVPYLVEVLRRERYYALEWVQGDMTLEQIVGEFAYDLYLAITSHAELKNQLEIKLLKQLVDDLPRVAVATEALVASSTNIEATVKHLAEQVELLIQKGGDVPPTFWQDVHQAVQAIPMFAGQYQTFQRLQMSLIKAGHLVEVQDDGELVISSTQHQQVVLETNVLQQLTEEINYLRRVMSEHILSASDLDLLEGMYCDHLENAFKSLTFAGMMRTARHISIPLEDIYVEMRSVAEVPEAADTFSATERRLMLLEEEKDDEERNLLLKQLDALRQERWQKQALARKSITEALVDSDHRAFVVLGDPGSGKTTLLHLLALLYARGTESLGQKFKHLTKLKDRLPIFVPLAAFDDMQRQNPQLTLSDFLSAYYEQRQCQPRLKPVFEEALEAGRALILFDGLDEVLDTTTRNFVSRQVDTFIHRWQARGNRFVVTSRFVGYREAPLSNEWVHLSVLDFGITEIEQFIHQWAYAMEESLNPDHPQKIQMAQKLKADLLSDVHSNQAVRNLAANPLMLTLLALLRRQVGALPSRRVALYKNYLETFIVNWLDARSQGERREGIERLGLYDVEALLIPMALWLQETTPSGTVRLDTMKEALLDIHLQNLGFDDAEQVSVSQKNQAREWVDRFLAEMRHMTGLIVERGHNVYGFLHLTFQEYLAGRALASLPSKQRWERLKPHLHDPRWHEIILLCAGQLGILDHKSPEVTAFTKRILEHQDEYEPHLHRNLLLALDIAGDNVNLQIPFLKQLSSATINILPTKIDHLNRQIYLSIVQIMAHDIDVIQPVLEKIWEVANENLYAFFIENSKPLFDNQFIREKLLANMHYVSQPIFDGGDIGLAAVNALVDIIEYDSEMKMGLLARLTDENRSVRQAAAQALGSVVSNNEEVRAGLLARLTDENGSVRQAAAQALGS